MKKILIVDDEDVIRMLYAEELQDEGYDVITTGSGHDLTGLVERERPDLIILDIKMAEHNGLDLLQDLRKEFYNIPVILCSAYSSHKGDLKASAADYYVVKSADLSELKQKTKMALEGYMPAQSSQE
ncbi:MAG: two-component system response regulator [Desulfobacterales bacterium C00003060]|nr:MAG: two-component system response regulator [Desulfobacterales bacterium C00003060]OEU78775.1 MAG: two-component system response regulator [Desulfobacterales bacterium S5133MH4]